MASVLEVDQAVAQADNDSVKETWNRVKQLSPNLSEHQDQLDTIATQVRELLDSNTHVENPESYASTLVGEQPVDEATLDTSPPAPPVNNPAPAETSTPADPPAPADKPASTWPPAS